MGMARRRGARVDPALLSTPHPAHSPSRDGRLSTPYVASLPRSAEKGKLADVAIPSDLRSRLTKRGGATRVRLDRMR
jgi:hypothetical protein